MKDFAVIPAAGSVVPDARKGREFPVPRGLLSLGAETVVGRLVRQAKSAGFEILIGINEVGTGGWTKEHVERFEAFGCRLFTTETSAYHGGKSTTRFLLSRVLKDPQLEDGSRILQLYGDWVYSEGLFQEMLAFRWPCVFMFQPDDWNTAFTGREIRSVIELLARYPRGGGPGFWKDLVDGGFEFYDRHTYAPDRFVEIDWLQELEGGRALVMRDA